MQRVPKNNRPRMSFRVRTLIKPTRPRSPLLLRFFPPSVLQVARKRLALRGPAGFFSLSRRLRSAGYFRQAVPPCHPAVSAASAAVAAASSGVVNADPGGVSGPFLSLRDFKGALSEIGCGLTGKDLTNVFMHLDEGGRDEVCM